MRVGEAVGVCGDRCGLGCVPVWVLAWASWCDLLVVAARSWAWVPWGMVVSWLYCFGFPLRVPASGQPVAFGYRGTGQGVLTVGGQR